MFWRLWPYWSYLQRTFHLNRGMQTDFKGSPSDRFLPVGGSWGGARRAHPPPLILGKKKRIPEGRKAGRESRKKLPPPPLSLRSGSANVTYDLLEVRRTDDVTINKILPFYHTKQIHFMLLCISLATDHQRRQNVIKNKNGTHSCASCATFVSYHITTSSVTGDRSYLRALFTSASFPKSSPSFSWHTTPLVRMKI